MKKPLNLFITGTDTGVGKTYFSTLLISAIVSNGENAVGFKPISCGDREDAEILLKSSYPEPSSIELINPIHLKPPAAPLAAALIEGKEINSTNIK